MTQEKKLSRNSTEIFDQKHQMWAEGSTPSTKVTSEEEGEIEEMCRLIKAHTEKLLSEGPEQLSAANEIAEKLAACKKKKKPKPQPPHNDNPDY